MRPYPLGDTEYTGRDERIDTMTDISRPLAGCVAGLSISAGDDGTKRGFPSWQVNRVTLQIVAALFGQGASVVFGHDWREDGVMEAVYGFARQVQPPVPLSEQTAAAEGQPLLRNLVAWPDNPFLRESDLERLRSTLRVEEAGLPRELLDIERKARSTPDSLLYRYVRARGLTFLRHRLNEVSHVRVCLGGPRAGAAGRYPGIIEEALLAVRENKPLYLAGFLGGAAEQVIDAIEGRAMREDFCPPASIQDCYLNPPVNEHDQATQADHVIDRTAIWGEFAETGSHRIAAANGLREDENRELFRTPVIDRVIELVLTGLSRIAPNLAPLA
jgi:hypothetical protein